MGARRMVTKNHSAARELVRRFGPSIGAVMISIWVVAPVDRRFDLGFLASVLLTLAIAVVLSVLGRAFRARWRSRSGLKG